jgi:Bifunctional DNA primase/polymerase, N-terminal
VLYLQPLRTPGLVSAQAEYQAASCPPSLISSDRDQLVRPPPRPRPSRGQTITDGTLRQALAFATSGWPVLPCLPGQKVPATAHGYRDATTRQGDGA